MSKFVLTAQLQLQGPKNVRQVVSQIQSQLKGVNVDLGVKGGQQAQRQIKKIADESNRAATAAGSMGKALGVSIRRFTGLAIATRAVSLFTNSLGAAVKESIAFERELIKISQVTGKSISQLKDLTNSITSLATGLGVSSTSLLSTSRILSQAGLSAKETETALRALAKTELAPTFDDIGRTAEGAVAIFNQFRLGAGALEGQLGSLNAVAGKFAVESGDLIATIRRTGGVFKAAGGDLNELVALFTSVRSTTRESAESIATGLRTILTRIQRPRTIEYLRQYGVELETLEGKFVGPFEAVRQLSKATAGLEQGDLRFVEIAEEIAGFRQIGKVIPLLREFRVAQEALVVAQGGVNSLTDDAAKAQASLAVRIVKVKEEFLALIRSVTETMAFQTMAGTVLTLAEALIKLGEAIKPVLPLLSALVAVRAIRGIGNFAGGIGKGLQARGFARGGVVPGSGNRDTVPAMLTPGEFVIKKSSVAKLGTDTLSAMNENRYQSGTTRRGARNAQGMTSEQVKGAAANRVLRDQIADQEAGVLRLDPSVVGGLFMQEGSASTPRINMKIPKGTALPAYAEGADRIRGQIYAGKLDPKANENVRNQMEPKLIEAVQEAAAQTMVDLEIEPLNINEKLAAARAVRRIDLASIEGFVFEAFTSGLTGLRLEKKGANFDFANLTTSGKGRLGNIFSGSIQPQTRFLDAKRTMSTDALSNSKSSIAMKAIRAITAGLIGPDEVTKFATGGAVGTDTVPALLTPGEFVVNRSSAKAIGYGNLNRMNKVGKYANGGIVQQFADGTPMGGVKAGGGMAALAGFGAQISNATKRVVDLATGARKSSNAFTSMSGSMGKFAKQTATAQAKVQKATAQTSNGLQQVGFGLSIALSTLSTFVPAVDESSGAAHKLTSGLLGLGLQLSVAVSLLEAFGLSLNSATFKNFIQTGVGQFAAGLTATVGTVYLINTAFSSLYDKTGELAKAIEAGNIQSAGRLAGQQAELDSANTSRMVGGGIGGALGFAFGGPIGSAIGAAAGSAVATGISNIFGTNTEPAIALARANAAAAAAAKKLSETQDELNQALSKGQIEEAKKIAQERSNAAKKAIDENKKVVSQEEEKRRTNRVFNLFTQEGRSGAIGDAPISERQTKAQDEIGRQQRELVDAQFPLIEKLVRTETAKAIASGGSTDPLDIREAARLSTDDPVLKDAMKFAGTTKEQNDAIINNIAEVKRATEAFNALNLGLGPVNSATGAAIVGLTNLSNNLKSTTPPLTNSINVLEASATDAAAGISAADFESALDETSSALRQFGADDSVIKKSRQNAKAFANASKEFPSIFARVKDEFGGASGIIEAADSTKLQEAFAKQVEEQLKSQNFDPDVARRVGATVRERGLKPEEIKEIQETGNLDVFKQIIQESAKDAMTPLVDAAKKAAEVQKQLIPFIERRIEAERRLVEAQQKAIDISMEARNAEADFGGPRVSLDERRRAVAARSNVLGRSAGLSDVGTGVDSFAARREEIRSGFTASQLQPGQQMSPEQKAQQDKLKAAQQDQVNSIRELIKIQKDEIATIQEKQRLEKDSLDSLLSGDIEKFFEQQAAQGAIAASATGNQSLMNAFGVEANAMAAQELRRMEGAGVTEVFGRQLGGAGGLVETTSTAAFRQRGLDSQAALRAGQITAGTTPELEAAREVGRGLAAELAASGELGAGMAGDELVTAGKMLQEAARRISEAVNQTGQAQQRGDLTTSGLEQGRANENQAKAVAGAERYALMQREKMIATEEALQKTQEDNRQKVENYGTWVDYATKVQREGGQLSKKQQETFKTVVNERAEAAIAEADGRLAVDKSRQNYLLAEEGVIREQEKLAEGKAKSRQIEEQLNSSGRISPESAASTIGGGALDLGRKIAGDIGAAEGRRRGDASFGGAGKFLGLGEVGAGKGRQQGEAAFDSTFSPEALESLNAFKSGVDSLQGMEVAHKLNDLNVNMNGLNFLENLQPEIKNTVIDEIQKQLDGYRPTSTGMKKGNSVVPTA